MRNPKRLEALAMGLQALVLLPTFGVAMYYQPMFSMIALAVLSIMVVLFSWHAGRTF